VFSRGSAGNQQDTSRRRTPMTERPETPLESGDEEDGSRASVGKDVERPGGGRTEGETAVDDAMGQGTPPEE
jgi:hypothetical protein